MDNRRQDNPIPTADGGAQDYDRIDPYVNKMVVIDVPHQAPIPVVGTFTITLPIGPQNSATSLSVCLALDDVQIAALATAIGNVAQAAQLPAALVGGRLDVNAGAWLGSTAPTVGQKTMAASIPVVLASDQAAIPVTISTPLGVRLDSWFGSVAPTVGQKVSAASIPVVLASNQTLAQLPAALGQLAMAQSLSVTLASDQTTINVAIIGTPAVTTAQLPAALVGGRLDTNIGAWLGSTAPTVGQKTLLNSLPVAIASDQTLAQLPTALAGGRLDVSLGAVGLGAITLGQKLMAASLPVVLPSDQTVNVDSAKFPASLGQKLMAGSFPVVLASDQTQLPASLGQKLMAASMAVVLASDQSAITVAQATAANLNARVFGASPSGSGASGNPVLIAGADGATNVRTLLTETDGKLMISGDGNGPTGSQSSVAASASSVTLLAAAAGRHVATIYNDSTVPLLVRLNSGAASATTFTIRLYGGDYYETPGGYTGAITGIWDSASGSARITEIT